MREDNTCDHDLDELYETENHLVPQGVPRKKRFIVIPVLLVLLMALTENLNIDISLGDILNISLDDDMPVSNPINKVEDNVLDGVSEVNGANIDAKLQQGGLLSDIVKDYFKSEYGLAVTVVDTVDVTEGVVGGDILKLITVKDNESGSAYEFKYYRSGNETTISDSYGSTLTSKLLGDKLTDYYKDSLPKGSSIWVDSESLGEHSLIDNRDIESVILHTDVLDLLKYRDEVDLFRGIGLNIVVGDKKISNYKSMEEYVVDYKSMLLSVASEFGGIDSGYPRLEVCFIKGESGKSNIMSYLEQKIGLATVGGSFFINWYDEIPMMGEGAKDSILGAMSIKSNPLSVLTDYFDKGVGMYMDKVSDKYIPVYNTVDGIMENSIANEQRSLSKVLN